MLISGRKMFWPTSTREALALAITSGSHSRNDEPEWWRRNTRDLAAIALQALKRFSDL
jgi:hypothetical protein